jgi:hypothetical protein
MNLNLPIFDHLANSQNILIAGAGGGFDIFSGLPLYFALRAQGKMVHLANYSFTDFEIATIVSQPEILVDELVMGARAPVMKRFPYFPEGYLSQWFKEVRGEDVTVWMLAKVGVTPLIKAYQALVEHLGIDALVLVDGGVDSIMRGDEIGAGTLVEDSISLAAADRLDIPVKILACIGFGTEVEEAVCHYNALENMAALTQEGGFLGSCALIPQMEAFELFEAACRYVWEQPGHAKSHISTRIIPAVHGHFGNHHMYPNDPFNTSIFLSPLMSLYWFFDAAAVIKRNLIIDLLRPTFTTHEAMIRVATYRQQLRARPRRTIPYS